MINLLRRVRQEYLKEGSLGIYVLYALGEVTLVMAGILLALQVDNWNQKRIQKQVQIDNIENFYFSMNEDLQVSRLAGLVERAARTEEGWISYLRGEVPMTDSLLVNGYLLGATAFVQANKGFYVSLQEQGLETIEDKTLRLLLSQLYEENFPSIQEAMESFNERFGDERIRYFKKYFVLDQDKPLFTGVNNAHFEYFDYQIKEIKDMEALKADQEFLEFVKISMLFHQSLLRHLIRTYDRIVKVQDLVRYELSYARYGTPAKKEITLSLKGFQDAAEVFVSGDFNNWRPDGTMLRSPGGWERTFDLFPGTYEYKFIIDGTEWILDPANPDSLFVPEVGSYNSIFTIEE